MLDNLKNKLNDDIYKNSIFLMMSVIVMTGFGFFFWTIAARLFNTNEIGIATTIISAFSLITSIAGFGLGVALIRFLPSSNVKNQKINSAFSASIFASILVSIIFLLGINYFSPKLLFIKENLYYSIIFIFGVIISILFNLVDSVFVAYKSAKYVLIKDSIYSSLKLALIFIFAPLMAFGIFVSWITAFFIAFMFGLIILMRKFSYKPRFVIYDSIMKKIFSFSLGNHLANLIKTFPSSIIPLLITNILSPSNTAYYYVAFNIAGLLFMIPNTVASSLFAKASGDEKELGKAMKKSIVFILLLLIPAMLLFLLFGKYLLLLFGQEYSGNAITVLNLLTLSSLFVAISSLYLTYLNVKQKIKRLVFVNLVICLATILFVYLLMPYGLKGIGLGYLLGQAMILLFVWFK